MSILVQRESGGIGGAFGGVFALLQHRLWTVPPGGLETATGQAQSSFQGDLKQPRQGTPRPLPSVGDEAALWSEQGAAGVLVRTGNMVVKVRIEGEEFVGRSHTRTDSAKLESDVQTLTNAVLASFDSGSSAPTT